MFRLYAELVFLCSKINDNSINVVSLKGPLLARKLFKDITIRQSKDLDLLVAIEDIESVKVLLESLGYQCLDSKVKYQSQDARKYFHDLSFFHDEKQINVELHWSLFEYHVIDEELPIDLVASEIPGLKVLSSQSDFLYLIIHAAKHKWFREKWLIDLVKYIELEGDVLIDYAYKASKGKSFEKLVLDTLLILKEHFAITEIPALNHSSTKNKVRFLKEVKAIQSRAGVKVYDLKGFEKVKFRFIRWREDLIISPDMWWRNVKFAFVYSQLYKVPKWWGVFRKAVAPFYYVFQLKKEQ